MKQIIDNIRKEVSKKRLYDLVKGVSSYHRIQASTGFRDAANYVCKTINDLGIEAKVLSFKADENQWYMQERLFQEWDCKNAWLDICDWDDLRIADFEEEAISIVQKSYPCDYRDEPLDIVLIEDFSPEYLNTLDLKGKLAFIHNMPSGHFNLIKEYGAVGFITDFMREVGYVRERNDAFDTLNYTSFWWKHDEDEPKTFGFVLSPRVGDKLRKLCIEKAKTHEKDPTKSKYPQAKCYVNSSVYPGYMEVVEAVLPGKSDEEIMMCAHLCHPKASANDNASGVAGSIEALRTLKRLTESGKIPPLEKTIRLILVPEMHGTYCYLSTLDHFDHIKGAINMDMIGGKQDGFYGPITITATHHAINSPITSIASMVLKYTRMQAPAFMGDPVPMVNSTIASYSGGSDHVIFSDTDINVPCIMLGQWPDKYYHTSSDTLECVDTNVLSFSTTFSAGYVYALSNFDETMHKESLLHHSKLMIDDLEKLHEKDADMNRVNHYINYYMNSTDNYCRYGDVNVSNDKTYIDSVGKAVVNYMNYKDGNPIAYDNQYNYVPCRAVIGPINDINDYAYVNNDYKIAIEEYNKQTAHLGFMAKMIVGDIMNWIDGNRTVNEIWYEMMCEKGMANIELIDHCCRLLSKLNLITIK